MIDINQDEILRIYTFWPQKDWRNFGRDKSRASWQSKKVHIKLYVTCNKNEQQQDARSNAEL